MKTRELDEYGHPKVKPGYTRIYEDQTGRWYNDYTQKQLDRMAEDPLVMALNEAITEEINREILKELGLKYV